MAVVTGYTRVMSQTAFRVTTGVFFGFAIASVIVRIGYQIHARRRLCYDDYFVLIGAICLCAAVGIVYKHCEYAFLVQALLSNPFLISEISADQTKELLTTPYSIAHAFFALSWTTIFAVKFSFLIFFKRLINRVSGIQAYYWIVIIISLLSWLFSLVEPLILCSHPNRSFMTCVSPSLDQTSVSMAWLTNSLDVLTDILIVSIPVIILRKVQIKTQQKLAFDFFLCLSTVMIIFAIIRASRASYLRGFERMWQVFWQILESCVALVMVSITAFRSILLSPGMRERHQKRRAPSHSWIQRAKQRKASKESGTSISDDHHQFPSIPLATFPKFKKYDSAQSSEHTHHHHRYQGISTDGSTTLDAETGVSEDNTLSTMKSGRLHQI